VWSPGIRVGVLPGSTFHQTEYFGPILGIMRAASLEEAVRMQNAVNYGLTAGIHSLDPGEVSYWLEHVEAGNAYVNRGITGAIVRRQPFGGWKKSSVGPTAKAGGPNYLFALGQWKTNPTEIEVPDDAVPAGVERILELCAAHLGEDDLTSLRRSVWSDQRAWDEHFGVSTDVSALAVERNVFRYRPGEITVRLSAFSPLRDNLRVLLAGLRTGARIEVSTSEPLPEGIDELLMEGAAFGHRPTRFVVESEMALVERVRLDPPAKIRLVNGNASVLYVHFDGNPAVAIYDNEVTESGRVEMVPFMKEQAVSITAHRFGAPDPRFVSLAL